MKMLKGRSSSSEKELNSGYYFYDCGNEKRFMLLTKGGGMEIL
jgi:hypothetical protein